MNNLPSPAFPGMVEYVVSVEIDAPLDDVWAILTDFKSYPLWNPYIRSAVVVDDPSHNPTEDQSLRTGISLQLVMQMPPSLETSKKPMVRYEHITLVDHVAHRMTWCAGRVSALFRGEHSHALSLIPGGKTLYATRYVIGGLLGYPVKSFMSTTMQRCLDEMSNALKQRSEGKSGGREI